MKVTQLIDLYLLDHAGSWQPTTLRSERNRLYGVAQNLDGNAETLWAALSDHKPYGRTKIFDRVAHMWNWAILAGHRSGPNPYAVFKDKFAARFRDTYLPSKPAMTYAEASARIALIEDAASRAKAQQLLSGGLRYTESLSVEGGTVRGKGGRRRKVYVEDGGQYGRSYETFRRHLAAVGLKPHDLRKLFATELADKGANEFELCEVMGWKNIQTATSYVQANQQRINRLVGAIQGGTNGPDVTKEPVS